MQLYDFEFSNFYEFTIYYSSSNIVSHFNNDDFKSKYYDLFSLLLDLERRSSVTTTPVHSSNSHNTQPVDNIGTPTFVWSPPVGNPFIIRGVSSPTATDTVSLSPHLCNTQPRDVPQTPPFVESPSSVAQHFSPRGTYRPFSNRGVSSPTATDTVTLSPHLRNTQPRDVPQTPPFEQSPSSVAQHFSPIGTYRPFANRGVSSPTAAESGSFSPHLQNTQRRDVPQTPPFIQSPSSVVQHFSPIGPLANREISSATVSQLEQSPSLNNTQPLNERHTHTFIRPAPTLNDTSDVRSTPSEPESSRSTSPVLSEAGSSTGHRKNARNRKRNERRRRGKYWLILDNYFLQHIHEKGPFST